MAKRKTIFDDKPVEIQELTYIIKQDIAHLNKQIGQLQTIAKYCIHFIFKYHQKLISVSGLREKIKGAIKPATVPALWFNYNPNLQQCRTISNRCAFPSTKTIQGWN